MLFASFFSPPGEQLLWSLVVDTDSGSKVFVLLWSPDAQALYGMSLRRFCSILAIFFPDLFCDKCLVHMQADVPSEIWDLIFPNSREKSRTYRRITLKEWWNYENTEITS